MATLYDELKAVGYDTEKLYTDPIITAAHKSVIRKPNTSFAEIGMKAFDVSSYDWSKFPKDYSQNIPASQEHMVQTLFSKYYAAASPEFQNAVPEADRPKPAKSFGFGKVMSGAMNNLSQTVLKGVGGTIGNAIENVGDEAFRTAEKVGEEVARPVESLLGQDAGNLVKAAFIEPARPVQQLSAEAARVTNRAGAKIGEELGRIVDQGSNELINIGGAIGGAFSTSDEEPLPALDPAGPAMTTADAGGESDPFNTRFFETVGKGRKRKGKGRSATIFGGQGEGIRPSLLSMKNNGKPKTLLGA